jgi:hypothetical protein
MEARLHRRVKAGHASRISLDPPKIVYTPIALANHGGDLADTDLRTVRRIERATRMVSRRDDREDHRAQNWLEPVIEPAVDENRLGDCGLRRAPVCHASSAQTLSAARRG